MADKTVPWTISGDHHHKTKDRPCLICHSGDAEHGDGAEGSLITLSNNMTESDFLLRILLEVPESCSENGSFNSSTSLIKICKQCSKKVQQAKLIYNEILESTAKFRSVQMDIVNVLKGIKTGGEGEVLVESEKLDLDAYQKFVHDCGNFVKNHGYDTVGHPLISKDLNAPPSQLSTVKLAIKSEAVDDDDMTRKPGEKRMISREDTFDDHIKKKFVSGGGKMIAKDVVRQSLNSTQVPGYEVPKDIDIKEGSDFKGQNLHGKSGTLQRNPEKPTFAKPPGPQQALHCCKITFNTLEAFRYHRQIRHANVMDQRKCPIQDCPMTYSHKLQLSKHIMRHTKPPFNCRHCGKAFSQPDIVYLHSIMSCTK